MKRKNRRRSNYPHPNRYYHVDGRVTPLNGFPQIPAPSETPANQPASYQRIEPAPVSQPINLVSAVVVPLLQTIITAILWALIVPAFHWILVTYTEYTFPAAPFFFLVLLIALLIQWHSLLNDWRNLLWPDPLEEIYSDHPQQAPEPITEKVNIQIYSDDKKQGTFLELPVSNAKLGVFSIGVSTGGTTAESAWIGNGQLFNRTEYSLLRDALITRGFAKWNSEQHHERGWILTEKGKTVFLELSKRYSNPLPSRA